MRSRIAAAVAAAVALSSCGEDRPDLVTSAWKALEVEYCLASGETKIWATTDARVLEALRSLMVPSTPKGLTMLLVSYTNELRLELVTGQKWRLYYRDSTRQMAFHDPESPKRSFMVYVSDALYTRISSTLIAAGGGPILLRGDCRIPSMKGK